MKSKLPTTSKIIFILFLLFILFGPFVRQVVGIESNLFRPWVMFRGTGTGIRDVQFTLQHPNGNNEEINRYQLLGYENSQAEIPSYVWRMQSEQDIRDVAELICSALDESSDLRVTSRIGTRTGWVEEFNGEHNFCQAKLED
jgi:hypothetical protein